MWQLVSDLPVGTITNSFVVQCVHCGAYYSDYTSNSTSSDVYDSYVSTLETPIVSWSRYYPTIYYVDSDGWYITPTLNGGLDGFEVTGDCDWCSPFSGYSSTFELSPGTYSFCAEFTSVNLYLEGYASDWCTISSLLFQSASPYSYLYSSFSVSSNSYSLFRIRMSAPSHVYYADAIPYIEYVSPMPETSTRPASLMQSIYNYNEGNHYTDNSETVNYYIGTLNVNGGVSDIYDPNLFNEETLVFTEPVTGAQYQTTGWTYDYATRCYTLDLASGTFTLDGSDIDTIKLTYGDDALTIDYYEDGSLIRSDEYAYVRAAQNDCALNGHTYTYETVKEATCTAPGERKYTCSVCGNEYAEEVPALGHDWLPTEVKPTTYEFPPGTSCPACGSTDFTAILSASTNTFSCVCNSCGRQFDAPAVITYGQTTYTCSRCGESYVEFQDEESGLFASIGSFIANGIGWVTDKLSDLINSISGINDIFSGFVERIREKAGDYPAFLGAVIACLPEDLTTVFWFAVVAAVVLAVWKKWFH